MTYRFKKLFAGSNLKMYKSNRQTLAFLRRLQEITQDIPRDRLELFFLPSYLSLADACRAADPTLVRIGAQNMHWEAQGQFTGEISAPMLQEIGVRLVMVGHAERRQIFGETDWMVNKRVHAGLALGFTTLVCVGDTAQDQEIGASAERLALQLKFALHGVEDSRLDQVWVAYEPVWAIGEGAINAPPGFANEMHAKLHAILEELYPEAGKKVPVLYGGSVNLDNAAALVAQPEIDGLFIGRAAWDADQFNHIIRRSLEAAKLVQPQLT